MVSQKVLECLWEILGVVTDEAVRHSRNFYGCRLGSCGPSRSFSILKLFQRF